MTSLTMPQAIAGPGLADVCSPIFRRLTNLATGQGKDLNASCDDLQAKFEDDLRDFESRAARQGANPDDVAAAMYALVALIDERILSSALPAQEEWLGRPLQLKRYDEFAAGEVFYDRLETLRHPTRPGQVDAAEVFLLALCFGFKGKLGDKKGEERRKVLIANLATDINQARGVTANGPLAPQARPPEGTLGAGVGRIGLRTWWLVPIGALVAVAVVALLLRLLTSWSLAGAAADIRNQALTVDVSAKP